MYCQQFPKVRVYKVRAATKKEQKIKDCKISLVNGTS